jgi:hypothetical protein
MDPFPPQKDAVARTPVQKLVPFGMKAIEFGLIDAFDDKIHWDIIPL